LWVANGRKVNAEQQAIIDRMRQIEATQGSDRFGDGRSSGGRRDGRSTGRVLGVRGVGGASGDETETGITGRHGRVASNSRVDFQPGAVVVNWPVMNDMKAVTQLAKLVSEELMKRQRTQARVG
jgi:hypothetical protein